VVHYIAYDLSPKRWAGRVCEYMHARAIHNVLTQGRTVQKGRGVNPGGVGRSRPLRFWAGVVEGRKGVVDGSCNIIISYVQEVCSKVVTFEEK